MRIGDLLLMAAYQPLWKYGNIQREQYRQELEEKLQRTRRGDAIIIGRDTTLVLVQGKEKIGNQEYVEIMAWEQQMKQEKICRTGVN